MCMFVNEIEQVVQDKVQKGELFTAFDVTKAVRQQVGRGTNVPHHEVKSEVHNLFANGQMGSDYTRTLGCLPLAGGVPQPWIYHRNTDNAANYGSGIPQLAPVAAPTAASTVIPVPAVTNDGTDPDSTDDGVNKTPDGVYRTDARDTLCVPKSLLTAVGLNPGDEAYVSSDPLAGCVVVSKSQPDTTVLTQLSTYTVDKYGNVRITQFALQNGGVGGKEFDIEGDSKQVYVRKH